MAPISVKISFRYGTHLPVLLQAMSKTTGPVLEMGTGFFSTPTLHWLCTLQKRQLVTLENNKRWHRWFSIYQNPYHQVNFVRDWATTPIEQPWDVVLIDHSPDSRRQEDIKRLAHLAKYIIIHDSNDRYTKNYHYDQIYPLFTSRFVFNQAEPNTTVLSNLVKLDNFIPHE